MLSESESTFHRIYGWMSMKPLSPWRTTRSCSADSCSFDINSRRRRKLVNAVQPFVGRRLSDDLEGALGPPVGLWAFNNYRKPPLSSSETPPPRSRGLPNTRFR